MHTHRTLQKGKRTHNHPSYGKLLLIRNPEAISRDRQGDQR